MDERSGFVLLSPRNLEMHSKIYSNTPSLNLHLSVSTLSLPTATAMIPFVFSKKQVRICLIVETQFAFSGNRNRIITSRYDTMIAGMLVPMSWFVFYFAMVNSGGWYWRKVWSKTGRCLILFICGGGGRLNVENVPIDIRTPNQVASPSRFNKSYLESPS